MNYIRKRQVDVGYRTGVGTMFVGEYDMNENNQFTSIEYFVIARLPLFPLGTYRIHAIEDDPVMLGMYIPIFLVSKIPMDWKRVLIVLATVYGMIAILIFLFWFTIASQNSWIRFLGVCVIIVAAAYGLVRYYMAMEDKKD